jgi:hypothetical protein
MKGGWWRWLSAAIAAVCGVAFGWVAGVGVARADSPPVAASEPAARVVGVTDADQTFFENHSSRRFQPSSASVLRKLGR